MIDYYDALGLIKKNKQDWGVEDICVTNSSGRVLAQNIYAPINLPIFDNSVVDGFACDYKNININNKYEIQEIVRANKQKKIKLEKNKVIKIMTGAPIPVGSNCVIMKEYSCEDSKYVSFSSKPKFKQNIRFIGEDVNKNKLILKTGEIINSPKIGLLLGLGISKILVKKNPKISIICTGDELVAPPNKLDFGQVYFFVGEMLKAQCKKLGVKNVSINLIKDDLNNIEKIIDNLDGDLVIITGGMSRGEYDLVPKALNNLGVKKIFHRGRWRPGMPLYFGTKNKQIFFGLPGNPVAVFVGFHIFVQNFVRASLGQGDLSCFSGQVVEEFNKPKEFAFFARGYMGKNGDLQFISGQGSHQIFACAQANALCFLKPGVSRIMPGERVSYYPI